MNFTFTYDGKIECEDMKLKKLEKSEKSVRFNAAAKLNKSSSGSRLKIFIDVDTPSVLAYPSALDSCIYLQHTLFGFYDSIVDYSLGEDQTAINYIEASKKLLEQSDEEPFQMDCRIDISKLDAVVPVPSVGVGPFADCERICVEINRDNTTFKCQVCVDPINIKFSHDNFIKLDCISIRLQGLNNLGIEYSWLMEFLVGKLKFDLCVNNIQQVISYLDAIMMFFKRPEFEFKNRLAKENLLPIYQNKAAIKDQNHYKEMPDGRLPQSFDFSYEKTLLSFEGIDGLISAYRNFKTLPNTPEHEKRKVFTRITTYGPLHLSSSSLRQESLRRITTIKLPKLSATAWQKNDSDSDKYLQSGSVFLDPITIDVSIDEQQTIEFPSDYTLTIEKLVSAQMDFLRYHDRKTRRLSFLYANRYPDHFEWGIQFFQANQTYISYSELPQDDSNGHSIIGLSLFDTSEPLISNDYEIQKLKKQHQALHHKSQTEEKELPKTVSKNRIPTPPPTYSVQNSENDTSEKSDIKNLENLVITRQISQVTSEDEFFSATSNDTSLSDGAQSVIKHLSPQEQPSKLRSNSNPTPVMTPRRPNSLALKRCNTVDPQPTPAERSRSLARKRREHRAGGLISETSGEHSNISKKKPKRKRAKSNVSGKKEKEKENDDKIVKEAVKNCYNNYLYSMELDKPVPWKEKFGPWLYRPNLIKKSHVDEQNQVKIELSTSLKCEIQCNNIDVNLTPQVFKIFEQMLTATWAYHETKDPLDMLIALRNSTTDEIKQKDLRSKGLISVNCRLKSLNATCFQVVDGSAGIFKTDRKQHKNQLTTIPTALFLNVNEIDFSSSIGHQPVAACDRAVKDSIIDLFDFDNDEDEKSNEITPITIVFDVKSVGLQLRTLFQQNESTFIVSIPEQISSFKLIQQDQSLTSAVMSEIIVRKIKTKIRFSIKPKDVINSDFSSNRDSTSSFKFTVDDLELLTPTPKKLKTSRQILSLMSTGYTAVMEWLYNVENYNETMQLINHKLKKKYLFMTNILCIAPDQNLINSEATSSIKEEIKRYLKNNSKNILFSQHFKLLVSFFKFYSEQKQRIDYLEKEAIKNTNNRKNYVSLNIEILQESLFVFLSKINLPKLNATQEDSLGQESLFPEIFKSYRAVFKLCGVNDPENNFIPIMDTVKIFGGGSLEFQVKKAQIKLTSTTARIDSTLTVNQFKILCNFSIGDGKKLNIEPILTVQSLNQHVGFGLIRLLTQISLMLSAIKAGHKERKRAFTNIMDADQASDTSSLKLRSNSLISCIMQTSTVRIGFRNDKSEDEDVDLLSKFFISIYHQAEDYRALSRSNLDSSGILQKVYSKLDCDIPNFDSKTYQEKFEDLNNRAYDHNTTIRKLVFEVSDHNKVSDIVGSALIKEMQFQIKCGSLSLTSTLKNISSKIKTDVSMVEKTGPHLLTELSSNFAISLDKFLLDLSEISDSSARKMSRTSAAYSKTIIDARCPAYANNDRKACEIKFNSDSWSAYGNELEIDCGCIQIRVPQNKNEIIAAFNYFRDNEELDDIRTTQHMWQSELFQQRSQEQVFHNLQESIINAADSQPMTPMHELIDTDGTEAVSDADTSQPLSDLVEKKPPMNIEMKINFDGLDFNAEVIPSLTATYSTGAITVSGGIGRKFSLNALLDSHYLEFGLKYDKNPNQMYDRPEPKTKQPAKVDFPKIVFSVEEKSNPNYDYIHSRLVINRFTQQLESHVINQIIFLQNSVITEVGDLIKKLELSNDKTTSEFSQDSKKFEFELEAHGMELTASTQSNNAIVLSTGPEGKYSFLKIYNTPHINPEARIDDEYECDDIHVEVNFSVDIKVGILSAHVDHIAKELGSFNTNVGLEVIKRTDEKDPITVMIQVEDPRLKIMPSAADMLIRFYVSYRSSYISWNQQKDNLQKSLNLQPKTLSTLSDKEPKIIKPKVNQQPLKINVKIERFDLELPLLNQTSINMHPLRSLNLQSNAVLNIKVEQLILLYERDQYAHKFDGSFERFELQFVEHEIPYKTTQLRGFGHLDPFRDITNSCSVPNGTVVFTSKQNEGKTIDSETNTSNELVDIDIKCDMSGLNINFNQDIGVYVVQLIDTVRMDVHYTTTLFNANQHSNIEKTKYDDEEFREMLQLTETELHEKTVEESQALKNLKSLPGVKEIYIKKQEDYLNRLEMAMSFKYKSNLKKKGATRKASNIQTFDQTPISEMSYELDNTSQDNEIHCEINYNIKTHLIIREGRLKLSVSKRNQNTSRLSNHNFEPTIIDLPGADLSIDYQSKQNEIKGNEVIQIPSKLDIKLVMDTQKGSQLSPDCIYYLEQLFMKIQDLELKRDFDTFPPRLDDKLTDQEGFNIDLMAVKKLPINVKCLVVIQPTYVQFSCQPRTNSTCQIKFPLVKLEFLSQDADVQIKINLEKMALQITSAVVDPNQFRYRDNAWKHRNSRYQMRNTSKASLHAELEAISLDIKRSKVKNDDMGNYADISADMEISKGSFKFDMTKLNEILGFPSAWYSKYLAKYFIGMQNYPSAKSEINQDDAESFHQSVYSHARSQRSHFRQRSEPHDQHQSWFSSKPWRSNISFSFKLDSVTSNMTTPSSIMGTLAMQCQNMSTKGDVYWNSSNERSVVIDYKMKSFTTQAKGGAISGASALHDLSFNFNAHQDLKVDPWHKGELKFKSIDVQIGAAQQSIFIMSLTGLKISLDDKWNLPKENEIFSENVMPAMHMNDSDNPIYQTERNEIRINLLLGVAWEKLSVLLTKSTLPESYRMILKLKEFFKAQLNQGYRTFQDTQSMVNYDTRSRANSSHYHDAHDNALSDMEFQTTFQSHRSHFYDSFEPSEQEQDPSRQTYNHRRHWPRVFEKLCRSRRLNPDNGTPVSDETRSSMVLEGTCHISGQGLNVAFFYGDTLMATSWAVLRIAEPALAFRSTAKQHNDSFKETEIIQKLVFMLGSRTMKSKLKKETSKLSTTTDPNQKLQDEADKVSLEELLDQIAGDTIESSETENQSLIKSKNLKESKAGKCFAIIAKMERPADKPHPNVVDMTASHWINYAIETTTSPDYIQNLPLKVISKEPYKNDCHIIFKLPAIIARYNSQHKQSPKDPSPFEQSRAHIDCQFLTNFLDHLYLQFDLNLLFYIKEITQDYIKEHKSYLKSRKREQIDRWHRALRERDYDLYNGDMMPLSPTLNQPIDISYASKSISRRSNPYLNSYDHRPYSSEFQLESDDCRIFKPTRWLLSPTIRLLALGGTGLEPPGLDSVLKNIGFQHAKSSIPKWIQRNLCDNVDDVYSIVLLKLVLFVLSLERSSNR